MFSRNICDDDLMFIMNSRNTKKRKSSFKILKVMKSMFKMRSSYYLLSNTYNDKF